MTRFFINPSPFHFIDGMAHFCMKVYLRWRGWRVETHIHMYIEMCFDNPSKQTGKLSLIFLQIRQGVFEKRQDLFFEWRGLLKSSCKIRQNPFSFLKKLCIFSRVLLLLYFLMLYESNRIARPFVPPAFYLQLGQWLVDEFQLLGCFFVDVIRVVPLIALEITNCDLQFYLLIVVFSSPEGNRTPI